MIVLLIYLRTPSNILNILKLKKAKNWNKVDYVWNNSIMTITFFLSSSQIFEKHFALNHGFLITSPETVIRNEVFRERLKK